MRSNKGLTLIELLVVMVIIGILAAIAVPLYTTNMQRARRSDAKTALEQVRATQEMWRAERGTYATDLGGISAQTRLQNTMGAPATAISTYYNWSLVAGYTGAAFTVQAVPTGSQVPDGTITIDQNGQKLPAAKWAK